MSESKHTKNSDGVPCGWLLSLLQSKGMDQSHLKERLSIYLEGNDLSDATLPLTIYNDTIEWAALTLGNNALGIELAKSTTTDQFGILGYMVANAASMGDALELMTRYYRVFSQHFDASYVINGDTCRYSYKPAIISGSDTQQDIDFSLGILIESIRAVYPSDWHPNYCSFTYPKPKDLTAHQSFFGGNLHFGQLINFIAFDKEILALPLSSSDPRLLKILQQHANEILDQLSESKRLIDQVKLLITTNLETETLNATSIASSLNMSARNMHRLLKLEDTSFQRLRDLTVLEIAKEALLETESSITDIALKLGFSESSAFVRKFKQQSGNTPLKFRKAHKK